MLCSVSRLESSRHAGPGGGDSGDVLRMDKFPLTSRLPSSVTLSMRPEGAVEGSEDGWLTPVICELVAVP